VKVSAILDQIDLGSMALPEFQRGYVWNREQVRGLMQSLYRKYPIGSLLIWVTQTDAANARGDAKLPPGTVKLLLDGQQRITTLYGIIRGTPPPFFDGNEFAFTGLYFHLEEESFEFYMPTKMKDNPLWIPVTELMQVGSGQAIGRLFKAPELQERLEAYINRLNAIDAIKEVNLHTEEVVGEDKTVDVVVDIFNRVNSGGTKLSKGDLALARICAAWPDARRELRGRLEKWRNAGFDFKMDWLLRNINTILTGEALFSALKDVDTPTFRYGLEQAEKSIDTLLNTISARLGLDHDRVLGGRYAFPVMSRYLHQIGGKPKDYRERDRLLYWYVHSFLWGRYAGSTETIINQDLAAIENNEGALDRLIEQLRQNRGDLKLHPGDFAGWSRGARFYPLLYLLMRTWGARDWGTGNELRLEMLGRLSDLQLHHIFPRSYLYRHGYSRPEVNALANFAFLTQETNLELSDQPPQDYFEEITEKHPGALESQWIPMDRELWKAENYQSFLAAQRELLAAAANRFLDELFYGRVPEPEPQEDTTRRKVSLIAGTLAPGDEEQILECMQWISERNLPEPEIEYELADETTGEPLAVLDVAWPNGLQEGYSQPVAVLLDEPREVEEAANQAGYRFFTTVEEFKDYVRREILAEYEPVGSSVAQ
jgi:hypothetical protein